MLITLMDCEGAATTDEATALAKQTVQGQVCAYFVRATREGQLFNPSDATARLSDRDRERGGQHYTFRRCSAPCYRSYTSFLRTRNKANLHVAERAYNNEQQ